jgi:hypothetical protein
MIGVLFDAVTATLALGVLVLLLRSMKDDYGRIKAAEKQDPEPGPAVWRATLETASGLEWLMNNEPGPFPMEIMPTGTSYNGEPQFLVVREVDHQVGTEASDDTDDTAGAGRPALPDSACADGAQHRA